MARCAVAEVVAEVELVVLVEVLLLDDDDEELLLDLKISRASAVIVNEMTIPTAVITATDGKIPPTSQADARMNDYF
ncbi:MAG: hypothetical protein ACFUZC_01780 [Chthoniobacteraceae bacterium]